MRRLVSQPAERAAENVFVAEGRRTIGELVRLGLSARTVLVTPDIDDPPPVVPGGRVFRVEASVLASVADAKSPQGVLAVFDRPAPAMTWPDTVDLAIIVDGLGDPGNLGTLIRTAVGFDAAVGVALPAADPWGPKVVRAAAGAHGAVRMLSGSWDDIAAVCRDRRLALLGLDAGGVPLPTGRTGVAWIVGNEARGLSEGAVRHMSGSVSIPVSARVESLNAAMSGSIALALSRLAS